MTRNVESIFGAVVTAPHQIPYTYTATGGETFISLPFYPVTGIVTINGGMQVPLDNFEIDGNTLNLGCALSKGDVVFCLFDKILSPQDSSNSAVRIYKFLSVGGETEFTPDFTAYGVQSLYIDGKYKTPGEDYNYFKTSNKVVLDTALPTGVWVVAEMNIKQNIPALAGNDGASKIGTSTGDTVETRLATLDSQVDPTLRQNLGSSEGASLSGYRYSDVYSTLSRIKTLYDYGEVTAYGHNLTTDAQIRQDAEDDNDLLIPGNVSIAKENRGVGRDGTALSVRMGTGDNSGYGLWPQVTGVSSTVQLANYGDGTPDGVAAYIDITGNAYADWEDVSESDVVYTETGCILTSSTAKIKRGNVIKTKHDTPFVGIVNSVDGSVITLKDGWVAVGATETSTPTAGFGCYINPQNKVWAINSNLTLSENGRSTIGVIQELGILNRKGYNSEIGGIDLVHLAQSTFDSGYGLRIRPANGSKTRSISGVLVQGSQYSFYSAGGGGFSPTYGLFVTGQHEAGAMFSGIGGSKKAIQIQNGAGVARTAINGDGYVEKLHKNTLVVADSTASVPDTYPDVISVVSVNQVITLTNSGVVPRKVCIEKFNSTGTLAVQPANGNILYKGSYVANVSITGAGRIELRLINITSDNIYQWAANVYQGV